MRYFSKHLWTAKSEILGIRRNMSVPNLSVGFLFVY